MKDLQDVLISGTFEEAIEAINNSDNTEHFYLVGLVQKAGVDPRTANQLVNAIKIATKKQLMKEAHKQTENMLYWVERA